MTQAARSDKSNIGEGSTMQSLKGYIKLLGTAQGSVRELADDFEDFLRQNSLQIWTKDDVRVRDIRVFWGFRENVDRRRVELPTFAMRMQRSTN